MHDMKMKALDDIQQMLEQRMSGRLAPKKAAVMEISATDGDGEIGEDPKEEKAEGPAMEATESHLPPEADKLSPEERAQLEQLYAKMGC